MSLNFLKLLFRKKKKNVLNINTKIVLDNVELLDKEKLLNRNLPKIFCSDDSFKSSLDQDITHYFSSSRISKSKLTTADISLSKVTQGLIVLSVDNEFLDKIEKLAISKKISKYDIHRINPRQADSIKINLFNAPTAEIKRRCNTLFLKNPKFNTQSLEDYRLNCIILSHFIDLSVLEARLNHRLPSIKDFRKILQDHSALVAAYQLVKKDFKDKSSYSDMFDYSLWLLGKKGFDYESPAFLQNTYDHVSNLLFWFSRFIGEYNVEKEHPGISTSLIERSISLANNIQRIMATKDFNNLFNYSDDSKSFAEIVSSEANTGIWLINYSCSDPTNTKMFADVLLTSLLRDRFGYEDNQHNELTALPIYCDAWSKYISREQIYWLELLSVEKNNLFFSALDKSVGNFRNYKLGGLFYFIKLDN